MAERIDINPEILKWAREGLGLDHESLAKASSVRPEHVREWEEGARRPTYRQLERTARKLLRDPSFFVGDEVPDEEPPTASFRRRFRAADATPSYGLLRELQIVLSRRDEYLSLRERLGDPVPTFQRVPKADEPAAMAGQVREILGVTLPQQSDCESAHEHLRLWIEAVERTGVLVFQASRIHVDEFRGLAIDGIQSPVILLNGGDSAKARGFTVLHEYIHLCLGESDFARQPLLDYVETVAPATEQYCNAVAAELLMPLDLIAVAGIEHPTEDLAQIRAAAERLNVSVLALTVRLNQLGMTTGRVVGAMQRAASRRTEKTQRPSGGPRYYVLQARNLGREYASTVMNALYGGQISQPTALALLGAPHSEGLRKLHSALGGHLRER